MNDVATTIDRYYRTRDAVMEKEAELTRELALSGMPKVVLDASVGLRFRELYPDLHTEVLEAVIAYDQMMIGLRVREVEAHERSAAWATLMKEPSQ